MRCSWVEERLLLYLAGELGPQEAAKIQRHQRVCARCAALAETLAETERRVEDSLHTSLRAPAALDQRVMAAVHRLPPPRSFWLRAAPRWPWSHRFALPAAALFLLIGGMVIGQWRANRNHPASSGPTPTLNFAFLQNHYRDHSPKAPESPGGLEPAQFCRKLEPSLPYAALPVDLRPGGARLVGGGSRSLEHEKIALLLYDWNGERISLFQLKGSRADLPGLRPRYYKGRPYWVGQTEGLAYVQWWAGDRELILTARVGPEPLLKMAMTAHGADEFYCAPNKRR